MRPAVACIGWLLVSTPVAAEFSGNIAVESLSFRESGQFEDQIDDNLSMSFEPRWVGAWNNGDDLWSVELFMRAEETDTGREHGDIRELLWLHIDGDNEWRVGINTMFWGVTESQHLVDVVNQIDLVEGIDGEEKLGQPMIHLKHYEDWGVLDFLLLPGFRERNFMKKEGRLRTPLVVDDDQAEYASSAEERHVDYAIRFSQTYGDLDLGVSWFDGTNRDPILLPGSDDGKPVLIPFYEQMTQLGVDAQLLYGDWIWRLEFIHRDADSSDYNAYTAGIEYTFYGVFESDNDFGVIVEHSYDDRPEFEVEGGGEGAVFDNDVFLGGRYSLNDAQSGEVLAGFVVDLDNQGRTFRVEGNRRFGESWKGTLELQTFSNIDENDVLSSIEDDDYLKLEMAYYF